MNSVNHELFLENVESDAHDEALMIDWEYDQLLDLYPTNRLLDKELKSYLLQTAIRTVDLELQEVPIGGKEFGYDKASKAERWWDFRSAHLADLVLIYENIKRGDGPTSKDAGQKKEVESFGKWLKIFGLDQVAARKNLDQSEPVYYQLFSTLEELRSERERYGEEPLDPVAFEAQHASQILLNVLDGLLSCDDAIRFGSRDYIRVPMLVADQSPENITKKCEISRLQTRSGMSYSITMLGNTNVNIFIEENNASILIYGESNNTKGYIGTNGILVVAASLSSDQDFKVEREAPRPYSETPKFS